MSYDPQYISDTQNTKFSEQQTKKEQEDAKNKEKERLKQERRAASAATKKARRSLANRKFHAKQKAQDPEGLKLRKHRSYLLRKATKINGEKNDL